MLEFIASGFRELLALVMNLDPIYLYLLLFGMAFAENIFPPLPGDTFTIIGGYLAAVDKLELGIVFLTIVSGTMGSVMLLYTLGYRGGREFFERKNFRFFSIKDMAAVDRWFSRYGRLTLLTSRFVVGGRVALAVGAGISRYPTGPMLLYSTLSAAVFHGLLIAAAYLFHAYADDIAGGFSLYSKIVLAMVTGLIILWFIVLIRRVKNDSKKT